MKSVCLWLRIGLGLDASAFFEKLSLLIGQRAWKTLLQGLSFLLLNVSDLLDKQDLLVTNFLSLGHASNSVFLGRSCSFSEFSDSLDSLGLVLLGLRFFSS